MIAEKVIVSIIVVAQLIKEKLFYRFAKQEKILKRKEQDFFAKKKKNK